MTAAQRAINDERYAKMQELMEALPTEAKEYRFGVYRAQRRSDSKRSFRPLERIMYSVFKDGGFSDNGAFAAYLHDKWGPGRYFIEPLDEHNQRITKIASWVVATEGEDMNDDDMDDDYEDERPNGWRRGRRRSRRDDEYEDEEDDPRDARANMADLLSTSARAQASQVSTVAKQSSDMMTVLLMTQQQSAEARAAEERRREDQRAEERRREDARAEERRREQEQERKEREEREERRREEARRHEDAMEARRREDQARIIDQSNKRTEMLLGAFSAAVPIIGKLFEKKESETDKILFAKLMEKPQTDPMLAMLLKSTLDKANDDSAAKMMFAQMTEFSKMNAQMTAEQMRSMLALANDVNGTVMKKAMDMMLASPQGQTPEGKSMIEQVMSALSGAAEIVKTLVPPAPPQPAQPARIAHRAAPEAQPGVAQSTQSAQPAPAQSEPQRTPTQEEYAKMSPEEQARVQAQAPRGTQAVLQCLMALQTKQYGNQTEYQGIIGYMVQEMPLDLRVAVLDSDQAKVLTICQPIVEATKPIKDWIFADGVLPWIQTFVAQLGPSIEAVHGPADKQRELLAQGSAAPAPAPAPPAEAAVVAHAGTADAAVVKQIDAEQNAAEATPAPTGEAAPIINGPGSDQRTAMDDGPQVPLPDRGAPAGASHLDDPDAP